ncbi:hypothetical protein [Neorhizobium sp. T7_12]|uniref:hypothetical protein n=1 Tax=Neorhizobium sp. T7_12 TaxID=2093832 RepID=UPI00155E7F02|nr:hypothetical protein [Neorhizobium sp. T7_12]
MGKGHFFASIFEAARVVRTLFLSAALCISTLTPQMSSAASNQTLSDGRKWVVLASRADLGEAIEIAKTYVGHQVKIMNSENGWFAVVLGPYRAKDIGEFKGGFQGPSIPNDAYLALGKNFLSVAWTDSGSAQVAASKAPEEDFITWSLDRYEETYEITKIPLRFQKQESEDGVLIFRDGEQYIRIQVDLSTTAEDLLNTIKGEYPGNDLADGGDKDFQIIKSEVGKSTAYAYVTAQSPDGSHRQVEFATAGCCDGHYLRFIFQYPSAAKVDWLQAFYKHFQAEPVQGNFTHAFYIKSEWEMPLATTPALSERDRLYDACAASWNKLNFHGQRANKAMAVYEVGKQVYCSSQWRQATLAAARSAVQEACKKKNASRCHLFALGDELSQWAKDARNDAEYGGREAKYRQYQQSRRQPSAPVAQSDDGGSLFDDLLGAAGSIAEGALIGANIGATISGAGSSVGSSGGSGSGGGGKCAHFRSAYATCERSWRNIGGGSSGQAGSFKACMDVNRNAMISLGC